jgi:hypothetical protein
MLLSSFVSPGSYSSFQELLLRDIIKFSNQGKRVSLCHLVVQGKGGEGSRAMAWWGIGKQKYLCEGKAFLFIKMLTVASEAI